MIREEQLQSIVAALADGPKSTPQLIAATGFKGSTLGNMIKTLLKREEISRERISAERYRYYIGKTAPGWQGYECAGPKQKQPAVSYSVPVRQARIWTGERFNVVTVVALPWEAA